MIVIPIALPYFMIERKLGYSKGLMGETFGICVVLKKQSSMPVKGS